MPRVGVADHVEQRMRLRLAVDDPAGVENLVPAVLAVGLGEHHELDVGRIAADAAEVVEQVVDFVIGQGEAHLAIRALQRRSSAADQSDGRERPGRKFAEQALGVIQRRKNRFGHAIVNERQQSRPRFSIERGTVARTHGIEHAAFDSLYFRKAAVMRDVGRFRGPR